MSEAQLTSLTKYIESLNGSAALLEGWTARREWRVDGATAGTYDFYYYNAIGKKFRSKAEVARIKVPLQV